MIKDILISGIEEAATRKQTDLARKLLININASYLKNLEKLIEIRNSIDYRLDWPPGTWDVMLYFEDDEKSNYISCSEWISEMLSPTYLFDNKKIEIDLSKSKKTTKYEAIDFILKASKEKENKINQIVNTYYDYVPFENYLSFLWKKTTFKSEKNVDAVVLGNTIKKHLEFKHIDNEKYIIYTEGELQDYLQYLSINEKVKVTIELRAPKKLTKKEYIAILPKIKKEDLDMVIKEHKKDIKEGINRPYAISIEF